MSHLSSKAKKPEPLTISQKPIQRSSNDQIDHDLCQQTRSPFKVNKTTWANISNFHTDLILATHQWEINALKSKVMKI